MSSTRFVNNRAQYKLECDLNNKICTNRLYEQRTKATNLVLPNAGIYPSHVPGNVLSSNCADIESQLFGIGSNDLVHDRKIEKPQINSYQYQAYFYRPKDILIPDPLVVENNQRPIVP